MVERDLAKVDVAGSTPVSRSRFSPSVSPTQVDFFDPERYRIPQRRGTQVVRERSAKPLCVGSIPTRASKLLNDWACFPYNCPGSIKYDRACYSSLRS